MKRCPFVLTSGPRAGQVCGRRYLAGDGCEKHREVKPRQLRKQPTAEYKARKRREYRERDNRSGVGVPASWAGVV